MKKLLFGVLCTCLTQVYTIPSVSAQAPVVLNHTARELETQSSIMWAFAQDTATGIIYMANNNGVMVHDGKFWTFVPTNTLVRSLAIASNGRVYVGCASDFGSLEVDNTGKFYYQSYRKSLNVKQQDFSWVTKVFIIGEYTYYVADENMFRTKRKSDGLTEVISMDPKGLLYGAFVANGQIYTYIENSGLHIVDENLKARPAGLNFPDTEIVDAVTAPNGQTLIAGSQGLYILTGNNLTPITRPAVTNIWNVTALKDGRFALSTSYGILVIDAKGNVLQTIDKNAGLPSTEFYALFGDRHSNLWVGHTKGVSQVYTGLPIISTKNIGKVHSLRFVDNKVFACTNQGVFYWNGTSFSSVAGISVEAYEVRIIQNRLLAWTFDGLKDITSLSATPVYVTMDQMPTITGLSVSTKSSNKVWVSFTDGVAALSFNGASWQTDKLIQNLRGEPGNVFENPDGSLWIGTNVNGVLYYKEGSPPVYYNAANGFVDGFVDIVAYNDKPLFRVPQKGYFSFEGGKFIPVANLNTVSKLVPYFQVASDKSLWFFTEHGLKITQSNTDATKPFSYLPTSLAYMVKQKPTALAFANDGVWVAYQDEIYRYGNGAVAPPQYEFKALVRSLELNSDSLQFNGFFTSEEKPGLYTAFQSANDVKTISSDWNSLTFNLGATSFEPGTQFQYLLEGQSSDWSAWTENPILSFPKLDGGSYLLRVRAKNAFGIVSPEYTYSFNVRAPWYQHPLMYFTYAVGLVGVGLAFASYRSRRLAEANRKLEKTVEERTADLKNALDDLKSTQNKLIMSEKMAALGQLVTGVAHEINTPIGAVRASAANVMDVLAPMITEMANTVRKLKVEDIPTFMQIIDIINQNKGDLSSKEERALRRQLENELSESNVPEAADVARSLVSAGFQKSVKPFVKFLTSYETAKLVDAITRIGMIRANIVNIEVAVDRTSKIVSTLKSYSQLKSVPPETPIDLAENIKTAFETYNNFFKTGVNLKADLPAGIKTVAFGDELIIVWSNLIFNGIQAMGAQGDLKVQLTKQGQNARVTIEDTGMGIPPENLSRIFEPFFTTKDQGEGVGLGLDIARRIIEKHNGTIEVQSVPGNTIFSVSLPLFVS